MFRLFLILCVALPSLLCADAATSLAIFPSAVKLSHGTAQQTLVVQETLPSGVTRDVTHEATYAFVTPGIATLKNGIVRPVTNGTSVLKVRYGKSEAVATIHVENAGSTPDLSFRMDVMPVFMKAGCNSGGCHGSSRGKDGFRLSLFGYDPDGDYFRLTTENIGRRLNSVAPRESLLLEKGAGRVPHTGGERFAPGSPMYQTVLQWIEAGARPDGTNVTSCVSVEIMPRLAVLEGMNARQRFVVRAKYSDGTERDVTSLAVFSSNNETVASVSEDGLVTSGQRGEAFIMARFETHTVGSQVLAIPANLKFTFPEVRENNYIDGLVHAKLRRMRIAPSDVCDDATFLRRVHIDTIGLLPTRAELDKFLSDTTPDKREKVVDALLQRPEFADLWVMKFAELLQIKSSNEVSYKAALAYYNWLHDQFSKNVPLNQVVQQILTATGGTFDNPAANYFQIERDTLKTAENVAQVFMGMRIQCAQCHNHPFDRWTMNDYYGFASFFSQVGRKPGEDPRETIVFNRKEGQVNHPVTARPVRPKFLGGEEAEVKEAPRREVLARWLASPENPFFARNLANIVWAHFLGKGIIDPVDDVRISNPASNPELLDALASKFTAYQYDFRKLVRDICTSRTYQLSTRANESNAQDQRNFARASLRRMRSEVLLDCISQVTGTTDKFKGLPQGSRAVQIADATVNNYFLTTFGRASRETVCACEVRAEPNLSQALHLLNGNTTNDKIIQGGLTAKLWESQKDVNKVITELYLITLCRPPSEKELSELGKFFGPSAKVDLALRDVFWSLLNSKEFIFNH